MARAKSSWALTVPRRRHAAARGAGRGRSVEYGLLGAARRRIDNTAPAPVDVALDGGDQWRNQNAWTAVWENPDEGDRAPIVAADYKLCEAQDATSCSRDTQAAPGISRLPLTVPGPGEWRLSVWRTDAAGNQSEAHRSVPVTLRYDPEPPKLAFESPDPADPTLVAARAADECRESPAA